MAREIGSGSTPVADRDEAKRNASRRSVSVPRSNQGSRDSVAQRAAGEAAARRLFPGSSTTTGGMSPVSPDPVSFTQMLDALNASSSSASSTPATTSGPMNSIGSSPGWDTFMRDMQVTPQPSEPQTGGFNPFGFLQAAQQNRDRRIAERMAAGVPDNSGSVINWDAIQYDLGTPLRERTERAGGLPFEGPVDWGGIAAALFGGESAEDRDYQMWLERNGLPPDYSAQDRGPAQRLGPRYSALAEANQAGYVVDPVTGAEYHPSVAPDTEWAREQIAEMVERNVIPPEFMRGAPSDEQVTDTTLADLPVREVTTYEVRSDGTIVPAAPPSGTLPPAAPAASAPVQMAETTPIDLATDTVPVAPSSAVMSETVPAADEEPTLWDRAVDGSAAVLERTPIGGLVQAIFPEFWDDAQDTIRGLGDSDLFAPIQPDDPRIESWSPRWYVDDLREQPDDNFYRMKGFIDENGNGIDDRLEAPFATGDGDEGDDDTGGDGGGETDLVYDRFGDVVFPDLPPYNPGRDDEWLYFRRRNEKAGGGLIAAYADGGEVNGIDPRMVIIADAEDALAGEHPEPEKALMVFVETFGEGALDLLRTQVESGMTLRGKREPRMVEGEGGPKDDAIPARIDEVDEARLSDGEFVMTAEAVQNAGQGDRTAGAERLRALDAMLRSKNPDDEELVVERVG